MVEPFERLAPFLREFAWTSGWTALRPMQAAAIEAVLDSEDDVLITAATAGGKTEAAFLPILSIVHERPASSVQALYVGPLKALINNQFERLEDLCRKAEIPVTKWHGDAADGAKDRLVEDPRGVLQITPESIESLLVNRTRYLESLFSGLEFVVLDELHTFLGSDRGGQLRCQLERLRKYTQRRPRRLGLSATLGDPEQAKRWMNRDPARVRHVGAPPGVQEVRFDLDHFEDRDAMARDLFALTRNRKSLIFCNSRGEVEELTVKLNGLGRAEGIEDRYLPHHGSVSRAVREDAEARMKDRERPSSVVCTSTLELGIDVGRIDLVGQIDATHTVAAMVQRLGRSGRRAGRAQTMKVYATERESWQSIPFSLLQAVAVAELWREKWCEPVREPRKAYHVLFQQLVSLATERNGLPPAELVGHFFRSGDWQGIEAEDYELLLRHLVKEDLLQQMSDGTLLPGLAGERVVRAYDFYAMFQTPPELEVRAGDRTIGRLAASLKPGACFMLAGGVWRVESMTRDELRVVPASEGERPAFRGVGGPSVHPRVAARAREILCGTSEVPYLSAGAQRRLTAARATGRELGMDRRVLFEGGILVPWLGSDAMETLAELFAWAGLGADSSRPPWILDLRGDVAEAARRIVRAPPAASELAERRERETLTSKKFDEYLPTELLRKRHAEDELDLAPALEFLRLLLSDIR